jgi:putative selenate reductase
MMDAFAHPKFAQYRDTLNRWLQNRTFIDSLPTCARKDGLDNLAQRVPARLVQGVTLSTMHGCPPDEIEAICRYMLTEKTSIPL